MNPPLVTPLVMLVDDEAPFVETMTKRLGKRDLDVIAAFSGPEALQTLDKHPNVDVVILDVKMPGMDGIETLKKMKGSGGVRRGGSPPVVFTILTRAHIYIYPAILSMKK